MTGSYYGSQIEHTSQGGECESGGNCMLVAESSEHTGDKAVEAV